MIKDILTVVIPCKNEKDLISISLGLLNNQKNITGTRVIISDSSNDLTRNIIHNSNYVNLNIEIIDGGYPSIARNNGSVLCKTKYILFMDADIFLTTNDTIYQAITLIKNKNYDLITCKFRTKGFYSFIFPAFEFFRDLFSFFTPCAIGGFMLFNRETFEKLNGFVNEDLFAEDFHLSSKIKPEKFKVLNKKVYTTNRRFKKKGLWYMTKMAVLSIINKNNPDFFKNDHDYWL